MLQECKNEEVYANTSYWTAKALLLHSSVRFFRQPLKKSKKRWDLQKNFLPYTPYGAQIV